MRQQSQRIPKLKAGSRLQFNPWLLAMGALFILVIISYSPALKGGFIWDDRAHITRPDLRSLHGLYRIWFELRASPQYYPLLHTAFWIEHRLWGDNPFGYHLVNVLQHCCVAALLWLIMRRLLLEKEYDWAEPAAFMAAAVYALHPVQVESVAWISEQKNTLSTIFYLAAMLAYLQFDKLRSRSLYALATFLFVCALLSKTVTVTLPAAILVVLWWQKGRLSLKRDFLPIAPWFLIGLVSGLLTIWTESFLNAPKGSELDLSLPQKLVLAGRLPWFYLFKLFWPVELIIVYPKWTITTTAASWIPLVALLALLVLFAIMVPKSRAPLAALLFFLVALFPVLGFFKVNYFVFTYTVDHFQYLPSMGIIALACCALIRFGSASPWRRAIAGLAVVISLTLAAMSYRQCRMYRDDRVLFETTIAMNPACWQAHANLGNKLAQDGQYEEALRHFDKAIELRRDFAEAYINKGSTLLAMNRREEGVAAYRQALGQRLDDPEALRSLGQNLASVDPIEAVKSLERAVEIDPTNPSMHVSFGDVLKTGGHIDRATREYQRALEIDPSYPGVKDKIRFAAAVNGTPDQAIKSFQEMIRENPDNADAHFSLAQQLSKSGANSAAIEQYREVIRLRPEHVEAQTNLAIIYASAGRPQDAVPLFEKILQLKPDQFDSCMNLALAYRSVGRIEDAIRTAQHAREIATKTSQPGMVNRVDSWIEKTRAGKP